MLHRKEITTLLINAIFVKMLLSFPRNIVANSANSAWIQLLYNTAIALLIFFITAKVYKEKKSVIDIADEKFGKWLKIPVGILISVILIVNFLSIIRIFPETVKIVLLNETDITVIILLFALAAAFGAYMGVESIAQIHYIFFPIAFTIFAAFVLMLIPFYDIDNIMPVMGNGADKIFLNGTAGVSLFSDIIILNLLMPHAKSINDVKNGGYRAILIGGGISVAVMLVYCLVYPHPVSEDFMFPLYQLARIAHLSSFFSRFEAIFQFMWSILVLLYASLYLYMICFVLQQTFALEYYKPLIFPVTVISYSLSLLPGSIVDTVNIERTINTFIFPLSFIIPLVFGFFTGRRRIYK